MSEIEITPMTLSREDVSAMRAATSYVVRLEGERCRLELRRTETHTRRGFAGTNVELETEIVGTAGTLTRACFVGLYPTGAWRALGQLVRAGDVLKFYARENGNGYTRAAECPYGKSIDGDQGQSSGWQGLHVDELCVDVVRQGKDGRRHGVLVGLVLDSSICPSNTARAIRETRREVA